MGTYGTDRASGATGYLASKEEVALMRRIVVVLAVAALIATLVAGPAAAQAQTVTVTDRQPFGAPVLFVFDWSN